MVHGAIKCLSNNSKDQFYVKLLEEASEVTNKQINLFKGSKGKVRIVDKSLSTLVEFYVKQNSQQANDEVRNLKRQLGLDKQLYFTWVVKAYA